MLTDHTSDRQLITDYRATRSRKFVFAIGTFKGAATIVGNTETIRRSIVD